MSKTIRTRTFFNGERPMPASQPTLAHLAFRTTKGCGDNGARWNADELREWLIEGMGISHISTRSWSVTLPNGRKIGARLVRAA